ncbi:MAG: translation initiation factor IF-2 subunit gamma [Candidatus Micrarchaeia archaeon]
MENEFSQSTLNVGTLGHIDHGKTTLTSAITHVWTDKYSESIKRNMTIKLGYADAIISKCECNDRSYYTTEKECPNCKMTKLRRISILDAPGHEMLMATAIAEANIIDAIIFVISATEPCPMPQTREHMMIINILGIKDVIIVQTKIDVVGKEKAIEHYKQIKEFIKGSAIENAPIIPVVATQNINISELLEKLLNIKAPSREIEKDPLMYVVRSFDVNKPGANIETLTGGVIGGAVLQGKFKIGDIIEMIPGVKMVGKSKSDTYKRITTKITGISTDFGKINEAIAGGLVAFATEIDPAFAKADGLVGNLVGLAGKMPVPVLKAKIKYYDLERKDIPKKALMQEEAVICCIGTATLIGRIKKVKKTSVEIEFGREVCILPNSKIAIMRKDLQQRWRLSGFGIPE